MAGGAVLVGVWLIGWHSPVTDVDHVVVSAPRGLSPLEIRRASAIAPTDNVPAVDAAEVRAAVLSAIPAVADVRVTRSLPDTIRLAVTARQPFAALPDGDGFAIIDADGFGFDRVRAPGRVPVITNLDFVAQARARTVLNGMPEDLRRHVARISASTPDGVALTLRDSARVTWGSVEQGGTKSAVLAALLSRKAARYDVSAPMLPTTSGSVR